MAPAARADAVMQFMVLLEWDEDGEAWTVTVPAIPGCLTYGDTVDQALHHAEDAIRLNLEDMAARGEPLPRPDAIRTATVQVPVPQRS
jgi:antitoxin HicB